MKKFILMSFIIISFLFSLNLLYNVVVFLVNEYDYNEVNTKVVDLRVRKNHKSYSQYAVCEDLYGNRYELSLTFGEYYGEKYKIGDEITLYRYKLIDSDISLYKLVGGEDPWSVSKKEAWNKQLGDRVILFVFGVFLVVLSTGMYYIYVIQPNKEIDGLSISEQNNKKEGIS